MKGRIALTAVALAAGVVGARAETSLPLAPHRAAYEISLVEDYGAQRSNFADAGRRFGADRL